MYSSHRSPEGVPPARWQQSMVAALLGPSKVVHRHASAAAMNAVATAAARTASFMLAVLSADFQVEKKKNKKARFMLLVLIRRCGKGPGLLRMVGLGVQDLFWAQGANTFPFVSFSPAAGGAFDEARACSCSYVMG